MAEGFIPVRYLLTHSFCQRKLFLENVLDMGKQTALYQEILGKALRYTNRFESGIVKSIKDYLPRHRILAIYHNSNERAVQEALLNSKEKLLNEGKSIIQTSQALRNDIDLKTKQRVENTADYVEEHRVYGNDLWWALTPKYTYAAKLQDPSLGVTMVIDAIETKKQVATPHIYHKQNPPEEGVWFSQKLEAAAAMLLLASQNLIVQEAIIHYHQERRRVTMTPELKEQLKTSITTARKILTEHTLPPHASNRNKCEKCDLKEQCYDPLYMSARMNEHTL